MSGPVTDPVGGVRCLCRVRCSTVMSLVLCRPWGLGMIDTLVMQAGSVLSDNDNRACIQDTVITPNPRSQLKKVALLTLQCMRWWHFFLTRKLTRIPKQSAYRTHTTETLLAFYFHLPWQLLDASLTHWITARLLILNCYVWCTDFIIMAMISV